MHTADHLGLNTSALTAQCYEALCNTRAQLGVCGVLGILVVGRSA